MNRILRASAVIALLLTTPLFAQDNPGDVALAQYYNDLQARLADSRLSHVPFTQAFVVVKPGDTLSSISLQHSFEELDTHHLSAAIYLINRDSFPNTDNAQLKVDSTLQLPTVGDLYNARIQYERLEVSNGELNFSTTANLMREGARYPFSHADRSPLEDEPQPTSFSESSPPTDAPQPTPISESSPPASPALPQQTKPTETPEASVTWQVSLWGKRRAFTEHVEKLSELVAEKTNGDFILELNYGGLSEPRENLDGIYAGKFEMAQFCAGYHPDKTPAITIMELPYLGVRTLEQERFISQWLYRHSAVLKDFERWNALALMPSMLPQYNLVGVGQPPATLSDLAGLKVRATGGIAEAMLKLDAFPESLTAPETETALADQTISAAAFAPHAHLDFSTAPIADWWTTNLNPGTVHCPVVAGSDAINSLSPEHMAALYGSINESLDHYIDNYNNNAMANWDAAIIEHNITPVTFDTTELSAFREKVATPIASSWVRKNSIDGLPAADLYNLVQVALKGENPELVDLSNMPQITEQSIPPQLPATIELQDQPPTQAVATAADPENLTDTESLPLQDATPTTITSSDPSPVTSPSNNLEIPTLFESPASSPLNPVAQFVSNADYLRAPKLDTNNPEALTSDPLLIPVEWNLNDTETVGSALNRLANFIGYELMAEDTNVLKSYSRPLPEMHKSISGVTVKDGFEVLSGMGFITVFNHVDRSVTHLPKKSRKSPRKLPDCPANLSIATQISDGVYKLQDGTQCAY